MWPKANEKEPLASWDGPTNPVKLLLRLPTFAKTSCDMQGVEGNMTSRSQLWLRAEGKVTKERDEAPRRGADAKVPSCAPRTR